MPPLIELDEKMKIIVWDDRLINYGCQGYQQHKIVKKTEEDAGEYKKFTHKDNLTE